MDLTRATEGCAAPPSGSLRRFLGLLSRKERLALAGVLVAGIVAALFETAGVLSILPFMAIVLDPDAISRYTLLVEPLKFLGVHSHQDAVVVVGVITALALALGNAASAGNVWIQETFIARMRESLSAEIFAGFMRQPYAFHLRRDTPSLIKSAVADVDGSLSRFVAPLLMAIARGFVALGLITLIVLRNPLVAVGIIVILGGSYAIVYSIVRSKQGRLGVQMNAANTERSRGASEGLGGVKDLRVLGREAFAIERFRKAAERLAETQVSNAVTSKLPRYLLEVIAFGGIVAATILLVVRDQAQSAIPLMALYAFAGYRLMPAFQQIFASAVSIRFGSATVAALEADLTVLRHGNIAGTDAEPVASLPFDLEVRLEAVTFSYEGTLRPAVRDVSLTIRRNESLGLVGRSGSGKSTLVDLLLGLHLPTSGVILIDGVPLSATTARAWRKHVGYVPQSVFLSNASVTQNIAFGLPPRLIDMRAVERAAESAQALEFIQNLPDGFDTVVGERGVKLSGGQRQRIGIARALYDSPDVLIFDEATSALDGMTEAAVMDAVRSLRAERTIILIAHRLTTIEACERIVVMENGEVVAEGSYHDLMATSLPLKRLASQ